MASYAAIADKIREKIGEAFVVESVRHAGGGCINDAIILTGSKKSFFVKLNQAHLLDMFEAEAAGLEEIRNSGAIRAPFPVISGIEGGRSFLVLEFISLGGAGSLQGFGEQLATMHQHTSSSYGWHRDNTIGSTIQKNNRNDNWVDFWRDQRLTFQLDLAARNGQQTLKTQAMPLLENLALFFEGYSPQPSLLHGDLWSGNFGYDEEGEPVIYDPAVYFGDREADIAMTELFGGFGRDFYDAYEATYPLDSDYGVRKTLYNLYHILNHFNLFGGGYAGQALSMIQRLNSELR